MPVVKRHDLGQATIYEGDVRECLATIPADHFHCVVTSPPYWSLRSYLPAGHPRKPLELGSEPTPELFVAHMVEVFSQVRRVLRPDGLCWVDIGDCYAQSGRGGNPAESPHRKQATNFGSMVQGITPPPGLKPGDLCLIPSRLALALQADSWFVRQIVIWAKPAPMPESVSGTRWERCRVMIARNPHAPGGLQQARPDAANSHNAGPNSAPVWSRCPGCDKCSATGGYVLRRGSWRCTTAHEYVLMLAKSPSYFADQEAVKEDGKPESADRYLCAFNVGKKESSGNGRPGNLRNTPGIKPYTCARNPRSVWTIGPEPLSEPHYAAFPSALPEKCINASTSAKGCCPVCGAQVARIVDSVSLKRERPNDLTKRTGEDGTGNHCGNTVAGVESRTVGWRPTCDHAEAANPVPCRVLDPFGGSGTTALQALRMGREATLCELNPAYVKMAERRIRAEFGLLCGPHMERATHV